MPTPEEIADALWAKQDAEREEREHRNRARTLEADGSSYDQFVAAFDEAASALLRGSHSEKTFRLTGLIRVLIYDRQGEETETFIIPEGAQYAKHIEHIAGSTRRRVQFWWSDDVGDRRLVFERRSGEPTVYACVKQVGFSTNSSSSHARFGNPQRHALRLG